MQSLTTASGSRLFGSVVRALVFCPGDRGLNPARTVKHPLFEEVIIYDEAKANFWRIKSNPGRGAPILRHESRNEGIKHS